jgi:hypothetical protein
MRTSQRRMLDSDVFWQHAWEPGEAPLTMRDVIAPLASCACSIPGASLSESPVASVNGRPRRRCSQACACAACAREVRLAGQPSHGRDGGGWRRSHAVPPCVSERTPTRGSSVCRIRKLTNSSPSENPYALRGWATNCGPHASPHFALGLGPCLGPCAGRFRGSQHVVGKLRLCA